LHDSLILKGIKYLLTYLFLILSYTGYLAQKTNYLPDTTGVCAGDSVILTLPNSIDKKAKITWITPKNIEYNIKRINGGKSPGKYLVIVNDGTKTIKDSTFVMYVRRPKIGLRDTTVCKGTPVYIEAQNAGLKYIWNTGETSQKIKVESSGKYWVQISNKGCNNTDTFRVNLAAGIQTSFGPEVTFCLSDEIKMLGIKTPPGTKISWNSGATTPSININKEGIYKVTTQNKNCGTRIDSTVVKLKACDCEMIIPNSFTPNEDNKNDYFFPVLQCEYIYYSFTVFDKWGNQIFTTNNPAGKWDGRFKGNLCEEDIYVYKIESTEKNTDKKVNRSGRVSLIR